MSDTASRQGRKAHQFKAHESLAKANAYVGAMNSFSIVLDEMGTPTQVRLHDGFLPGGYTLPLVSGAAAALGYEAVVAPPPVLITAAAGVPFTVEHMLGRFPLVQSSGADQPLIDHLDENNVQLTFAADGDYQLVMV